MTARWVSITHDSAPMRESQPDKADASRARNRLTKANIAHEFLNGGKTWAPGIACGSLKRWNLNR
jgi:hypothetical protein